MSKQPKAVRVVVADDDPDVATSMVSLLPLMYPGRLNVSLAFDGEEAVRLTKSLKPTVTFLDVGMPGMDGIQAAFAIRKALGGDAPVLVAVSGDAERVTRGAWSNLFDHTLCKPLDVEQLADVFKCIAQPEGVSESRATM